MDFFSTKRGMVTGIVLSGLAWYISGGLNGHSWWLFWLAPVPVLLIAFQAGARQTAMAAFLAYLVGRLSWLIYLLSVIPLLPVILFTLLLPLIFMVIILLTRKIFLRYGAWMALMAYPVLFTGYEFLLTRLSRDGTVGSIAYSQADCLPLIQLASITGILGISFLISLVASGIAVLIFFFRQRKSFLVLLSGLASLLLILFIWGEWRLQKPLQDPGMEIGMLALSESIHRMPDSPDSDKAVKIALAYASGIARLAENKVRLVLLPEKIIDIHNDSVLAIWAHTALANQVNIIAGYALIKDHERENRAILFSSEGKIIEQYTKVNLFEGEAMEGFTRGQGISQFGLMQAKAGMAICKDMDFDRFIRQYGLAGTGILFVPAWDFERDDWIHSRMAILRGVENGFAIARNARQGCLTISDYRGKVLYEARSTKGREAILTGNCPVLQADTFYTRHGNWFGLLNGLASLFLILAAYFPIYRNQGLKK